MTSVLRHHCLRALGAGALSVALLSGGTAGALAVTTPGSSGSSPGSGDGSASISVKAGKSSVKAGEQVVFSGRTKGLKIGSPLVLQHEKSGKWTSLRATSKIKKGSSYALLAKLNTKGTEHLRIAGVNSSGKVYSPTVTVKVN
ncbi:hypothetical protein GT045_37315 [Streptomyces sp. SID486]|uniref:hypothetical protein n=1 Tax=unclassified Streptomyces TaxID=2593676 RepID=UPI001371BB00|nr:MULTISPECIES: hypothetical protein [unclassified Streptomyces]MYW21474.1 hypothetical protein [Streptomyces sp. SID2955]MYW49386.1 hypothetical protein [Streptomyces sp. SID161]MYY00297.1 hypothetical protein [Streptomyces sp. SID486]